MLRRRRLAIIILLISLAISACSDSRQTITPDASLYAVDPVFREFYNILGGRAVLGEVISPVKVENGVTYQYTVAGKMTFDPKAPLPQKFQLAPLGRELGIGISSDTNWEVAESFKTLYKKLNGLPFVGKPLTGLIFNGEKDRYEQYFENLGFYQGPETDGEVRLLPYGAWRCGEECRSSLPLNAAPMMSLPTPATPVPPLTDRTPSPNAAKPAAPEVAPPAQSAHRWLVKIWESYSIVSTKQSQEIQVNIQRDGLPLQGAQASLVLELPDGSIHSADFPPTDVNGIADLKIDPIQAKNGTVIQYQVCINGINSELYCVQQSFSIWSKP